MPDLEELRKEIACFMRRLYSRGLTTSLGGNISARAGKGMLITPSSTDKARMKSNQVIYIPQEENCLPGTKPSIESSMHLGVYQKRPEVGAIIHAHPPLASLFTAMQQEINIRLLSETYAVLGHVVKTSYAIMGSRQLADNVAAACLSANVILLENHGVVCTGPDLLTAFDRIEVLETAARATIITTLLHDGRMLEDEQLKAIDRLVRK